MSDFTYLHVHTHYSRAGGPASPKAWCARARELGYTSIGITDRAPLSGWPEIDRAARQEGLTPTYGVEVSIALPQEAARRSKTPQDLETQDAVLLATNPAGARNLARLASVAYEGWPAQESPVPWDILATHVEGLILVLLGGDEAGALQSVVSDDLRKVQAWSGAMKASFNTNVYLGLPHSGRSGDATIADTIAARAEALGLPIVALPSARYLQPTDAPAYEALRTARSQAGWPRTHSAQTASIASDRHGFDYLRSPDEVHALYSRWPAALENAALIVSQASFRNGWPFDLPAAEQGRATLLAAAESRLSTLPDDALPPDANEQLVAEINAASAWGSVGAWTLLASIVEQAANAQSPVPVGAPLGSAATSFLAYALAISRTPPPEPQVSSDTPAAPSLPGVTLSAQGRAFLLDRLASGYGRDRLALATCALDILPVQALAAAAGALSIEGESLRGLLLPAMSDGWKALADYEGDDQTARLATLALSLKGAPLTFAPDPDTLLAAPQQTYGSATLGDWTPVINNPQPAAAIPASPWSAEALAALGYPAVHLPPSSALDALYASWQMALRNPLPGQDLPAPNSDPALITAALKAQHPAAYIAGVLGAAWQRGEAAAVASIADEAHKLGVVLEPPHVNQSLPYATLQRRGDTWSVLWGLANLPGWSSRAVDIFVQSRPATGFDSLASIARAAVAAGLDTGHLTTLVMSGACDTLGDRPRDRSALLSALPALLAWATDLASRADSSSANQADLFSAPATPPPAEDDPDSAQSTSDPTAPIRSPYERHARRSWERLHLGAPFTPADDMAALISTLEASGDLRSRLVATHELTPDRVDASVHIVGLLSEVSLLQGTDGDTLAVGRLEDPNGSVEIVAFPPNYRKHSALWTEKSMVAVMARVALHADGDLYLLSEHLAPFTAGATEEAYEITIKTKTVRGAAAKEQAQQAQPATQPARPDLKLVTPPAAEPAASAPTPTTPSSGISPAYNLVIIIPDADEDQPVIDSLIDLKRLLEQHPGHDSVTIRVPYIRGKWTSASLSWGVRYSQQLEASIRRLLGENAVAVIQLAS